MKNKTHECSETTLVGQKEYYHYLESGLPNVYLQNITWHKCRECEGTEAVIPKIGQLHRCIAWRIIQKPTQLNGLEVRFLRKTMRARQSNFADLLGMSQDKFSNWENNTDPIQEETHDTVIRLFYLAFKSDEYTKKVHDIVKKELRKFELLRKAAQRPDNDTIVIDPRRCGTEQEVSEVLEG